jgi:hypothetical protein
LYIGEIPLSFSDTPCINEYLLSFADTDSIDEFVTNSPTLKDQCHLTILGHEFVYRGDSHELRRYTSELPLKFSHTQIFIIGEVRASNNDTPKMFT